MSAQDSGNLFEFAADLCMGHLMRRHSQRSSDLASLHSQLSAAEDSRLDPPMEDPSLDNCPKCEEGIITTKIPEKPGFYLYTVCLTCKGTGIVDGQLYSSSCNCKGDHCVC